MSVFGSLQLSHGLVLCGNQRSNKWKNSGVSRVKLRQLNAALSSRVSFQQQDSFMCVSDFVHRPIRSPPNRCISFSCYSFSLPGKAFELPSIKAASLALSKSYNLVQRSPLIVKLAPAFAILAFSLWGLVPLARQCRSLLNKSDNSWKKSSTYHVITSYVQPLLLWSGALLICRALDPISLPTQASQMVKNRLLNFVRSLSTVLAFAYCFSSAIQQTQKFFMETSDSSDARNMGFQFAGKALYSAVWVGAVSLFMELLGFPTQKWLTAGGFGTVLITLAGREIFTNFLSSIMIHATRPFVLNEWIQTKIEGYEVSGTVEHVGWWSPTIIRGEDREALHIPNHKFTVNVVRNLSQKTHWRIKTHLAISHLDVNKINIIVADMRKVLAKNPQVEQQRLHRRVFLENVDPENQALLILISCFVKTSHHEEYYCVKEAILLDLLRVISHHGARLATPIRTIRKMNGESDLDNFPYGDSRFGRGGMASKRPLLLIEPSYKINGEEKPKSQNRTSKPTNNQEAKIPSPKSKENPKTGYTPNSELLSGDESGLKSSKPNSKTNIKDLDTQGQDSTKPKSGSSTKQPKTENLRTSEAERADNSQTSASRSSLEENIVLGVALEGSKRTLPIEEETDPSSSAPQDAKELAGARRKGNGSSTGDKDNKKDGNMQSSSGTSNSEQ